MDSPKFDHKVTATNAKIIVAFSNTVAAPESTICNEKSDREVLVGLLFVVACPWFVTFSENIKSELFAKCIDFNDRSFIDKYSRKSLI